MLVNAEESPRVEWEQIQRLVHRPWTGSCWRRAGCPTRTSAQVAAQRPVVLMSRELPGLASVVLDHVEGCRQIVAHLASLGHRDLLYLAGPRNSWMAGTRWAALQAAAEQSRHAASVASGRSPPRSPRAAPPPTAPSTPARRRSSPTTTCSPSASCSGSSQRGVRVPEDVSVVGFDDIFAADVCTPGLTTLGGAHVDVGRAAVELLLTAGSRAADDQPRVVLPTALVLRRSTGNAPRTTTRRSRGSSPSAS